MSRYTGEADVSAVLQAADRWREQCFLRDGSILSDESLWTKANLDEFQRLYEGNPIEGNRDFFDKLEEQLAPSTPAVKKLAAEVVWFYLLFPHKGSYSPETKTSQVRDVWGWSGDAIPNDALLASEHLVGVGGAGVAYLTRRHDQLLFFLRVLCAWKGLTEGQRTDLITNNRPWDFVAWVDAFPNSDKRPIRNALLYFIFPDQIERIVSNDHRKLIYAAFKSKLAEENLPKSTQPSLFEMDKAIGQVREGLQAEYGTQELDFYRTPLQEQWSSVSMRQARRRIAGTIESALEPHGLELRQCGSKKVDLAACNKEVDTTTGFWKDPADSTNKPLRWIVHLDLTGETPVARPAEKGGQPLHGNQRIAFSNNAQEKSGAITIRIIPAIKVTPDRYVFYEQWEWLLLLCFYPALPRGSSGQLLDDFNPSNGSLTYMGHSQPYIFAALVALNVEDAQFSTDVEGTAMHVSYRDATEAMRRMIQVNPKAFEAQGVANAK
jgi:hypothetical protein